MVDMSTFSVRIAETNRYVLLVKAEDENSAVELAYASFDGDFDAYEDPEEARGRVVSGADSGASDTDKTVDFVMCIDPAPRVKRR